MGQKVHPRGFRLGVIESSDSKWFARRDYRELRAQYADPDSLGRNDKP